MKRKKSIGIRILLGIAGVAVGFFFQTIVLPMILKVLGLEVGIFPSLSVLVGFIIMGYLIYRWTFDKRIELKRYPILILVGIIVIISLAVVSYEQKQKQQKAELIAYLDAAVGLEIKSVESILAIRDAAAETYRAIQARDDLAYLISDAKENKIRAETLHFVLSDRLELLVHAAPYGAQTLRDLMIESLNMTQSALFESLKSDMIITDITEYFNPISDKRYSVAAEQHRQESELLLQALNSWKQVGIEVDNLLSLLGIRR